MSLRLAVLLIAAACAIAVPQDADIKVDTPKTEPKFDETFSGIIVELTDAKITISRSILGKPAENRSFLLQSDTRIEGKLKTKLKVTVGFVTTPDGDVARLIVARPPKPPAKK